MFKTHLVIGIFIALLFLPHLTHQLTFLIVVIIATILPDIDTPFSMAGKSKLLRPLQWLTKHRGVLHSFTFAILISIILSIFLPIAAFGFFLGYSIHLFADSFTKEGIIPLWPIKKRISGKIKTDGYIETTILITFLLAIVLILIFNLV